MPEWLLPVLSALAGLLSSALFVGIAWGRISTHVDANKAQAKTEIDQLRADAAALKLSVKILDDDRTVQAEARGELKQRVKQLEESREMHMSEVHALEARVTRDTSSMEKRIIEHFDRTVSLIRETSGTHSAQQLRNFSKGGG
jgi:hypothetical protein